jgi:hypothetical protein
MINYREWLRRAEAFISHVARLPFDPKWGLEASFHAKPPLSSQELLRLDVALPRPLPAPLLAFLEYGSGGCDLHYLWGPPKESVPLMEAALSRGSYFFGGLPICDAGQLAKWQAWCQEGAAETWIAEDPRQKEMWLHAVPFAFMSSGDFVALDVAAESEDPPVVYLYHDDASVRLASSFDNFLETWERLCYIAPDRYLIKGFRDPITGLLKADDTKVEMLRRLFDFKA